MTNTVSQILLFLGNNTPLVSFVGAIIGGEETLVLLSIYSAKGSLSFVYVVIFFYLGIMVSDILWYFVGKSKLFTILIRVKSISSAYNYWGSAVDKATDNNYFEALLVTKFLYGFRLPTIMYLARERLSLRIFFKYSLLTNAIWVLIIASIGWASGEGIKLIGNFSQNIILEMSLVGVVLILFFLTTRIISRRIETWVQNK